MNKESRPPMTMTTIINQFGDLVKQKGFNRLKNKKLPRANKIISALPFVKLSGSHTTSPQ